VTFDDGFRDNFDVAAPILARYGIRATFYITAGCIESGSAPWFCRIRHAFETAPARPWFSATENRTWDFSEPGARQEAQLAAMRSCAVLTGERQEQWVSSLQRDVGAAASDKLAGVMLTWPQVQSLHGQGHLIGSHTLSHPNLAHIPSAEAHCEIHQSKRLLEQHLGEPVRHFSYPCAILWPHWNAQTVVLTREAGYDTVTTTTAGRVAAGADRLLLPRVVAPLDLEDFRWAVEISLLGHKV
jgi:peptidoglycan/xylan/chitin deacetylase (PgdA/CDA1 family)